MPGSTVIPTADDEGKVALMMNLMETPTKPYEHRIRRRVQRYVARDTETSAQLNQMVNGNELNIRI